MQIQSLWVSNFNSWGTSLCSCAVIKKNHLHYAISLLFEQQDCERPKKKRHTNNADVILSVMWIELSMPLNVAAISDMCTMFDSQTQKYVRKWSKKEKKKTKKLRIRHAHTQAQPHPFEGHKWGKKREEKREKKSETRKMKGKPACIRNEYVTLIAIIRIGYMCAFLLACVSFRFVSKKPIHS